MKKDEDLQKHIQNAIKLNLKLSPADIIGVIAKDGVITLKGVVDSDIKKSEAENIVKNVIGVKAIVGNIEVNYGSTDEKSDTEIANDILHALKSNPKIPEDKIKIKVENGHVALEGELQWDYQKEATKKSLSSLVHIKTLTNNILIKPEPQEKKKTSI